MTFKIKRQLLADALKEIDLTRDELEYATSLINVSSETFIEIDSRKISISLLSYLLKNSNNLATKTKATLSMSLLGNTEIESNNKSSVWETKIKKLGDIVECFSRIGITDFNADMFFNYNWYPVILRPSFSPATRYSTAVVEFKVYYCIGSEYLTRNFSVSNDNLRNEYGRMRNVTLIKLLAEFGFRPTECSIEEYNESLEKCRELSKTNLLMTADGHAVSVSVSSYNKSHIGENVRLGTAELGDKVIIETELEYKEDKYSKMDASIDEYTVLPYIRIFSFLHKNYFFISVNDLSEYKYDTQAVNRLFLPNKISKVFNKIFSANQNQLQGDILAYKHGGIIILASGSPGIGKTSTAEVYSEMKKMPLYTLDISELGIYVEKVEQNLAIIFKRVEKWNAIILFDEVDIFLARRSKHDLNRTAIVGVFLRLMDYFRGIMFLTSNLPEVLDYAILSRVTIRIDYPSLNIETRKKIWIDKIKNADITIEDGFDKLSALEIDGRQIRNIVRLIDVILPKKTNQQSVLDMIETTQSGITINKSIEDKV